MTAAIKIVNRIPAVFLRLVPGGARKMVLILARALPFITQVGANQVENQVNAAGKVIKSLKDRNGFDEPVQVSPDLTMTVGESKRKHPRYRPPRKDPKTGKYDNPCGKGFAPGAQSGVKTKIGPQSGRRVSNCEPIKKKKNEAVVEAVIKRLLSED